MPKVRVFFRDLLKELLLLENEELGLRLGFRCLGEKSTIGGGEKGVKPERSR